MASCALYIRPTVDPVPGTSHTEPILVQEYINVETVQFSLGDKTTHLDELPGLDAFLECAAELVGRELGSHLRMGGYHVLLDGLKAGAVPLLQGLYGLEDHLPNIKQEPERIQTPTSRNFPRGEAPHHVYFNRRQVLHS